MYSIRVEGDVRALLRKCKNLSELDKKGLSASLGQSARESTVERFKRGKDPDGKSWKTSIRAASEGGKTLVKTAQLRNSIRRKSDATGFAVGTNLKYAATHQFGEKGRTIRARRAKALRFQVDGQWFSKKKVKIKIAARPFLGFSEEDMQEFKATLEEFVSGGD